MRSLLGIILFGIGIGLAAFVAWPQWDAIATIEADTEAIRQLKAEIEQLIAHRDRLLAEREAIDPADIRRIEAMAPRGVEEKELIRTMETLALQHGLQLRDLTIEPSAQSAGVGTPSETAYTAVPIHVTVVGNLTAFRQFLSSVEQNLRLIDVVQLSLNAPDGNAVAFPVESNVYYRP
ncbi:hypothetical protein C4552_00645 [Candidatus Parcubacteria bacterium]|nr:MAG: hypothetical protein C4552_00645 [Candidatus Parcubacteria bacterium]